MGGRGRKKKVAPPKGGVSKGAVGSKSDAALTPSDSGVDTEFQAKSDGGKTQDAVILRRGSVEERLEKGSHGFVEQSSEKRRETKEPQDPSGAVVITEEEWNEGSKIWENALVGYVLGIKPSFKDMANFMNNRCKEFQVPKAFMLRDGVFLFDFADNDAKQAELEKRWTFNDHPLILKQWTPDFDPDNLDVNADWKECSGICQSRSPCLLQMNSEDNGSCSEGKHGGCNGEGQKEEASGQFRGYLISKIFQIK
ncbi:hypothetical protein SLEP1_g3973 [Rubroshorea leprosula]|uniref:DUF4283 domain-containing protein n=1 Tax=Rubroshorea leprosula TaxID=152421 RepID=A0AAV5HWV3_9ROSI|nr:hypothetical protein SLEP1_g3973 [Rubroshorea leprosula]